jgi:hypothetical protein
MIDIRYENTSLAWRLPTAGAADFFIATIPRSKSTSCDGIPVFNTNDADRSSAATCVRPIAGHTLMSSAMSTPANIAAGPAILSVLGDG